MSKNTTTSKSATKSRPALKPIYLPAKIVDRLREIGELANLKNPDRALAESFLEPLAIRDVVELPYHIVEGWDLGEDRERIERECTMLVARWQAEDES
jgi:hypothetical protein